MNSLNGVNINDLKQLSQLISSDQSVQPVDQIQQPISQKIIKKVKIQSPIMSENSDIVASSQKISKPQQSQQSQQSVSQSQQLETSSPNFELMGYAINKHTIYLLIALILIGIGIWFMTAEKQPNKKENKKENKDENEKENKDENSNDEDE